MVGKIRVLAVVGPTASGKTALAAELAARLGGEVVSADSMQLYRGMEIGTARPTNEEMRGIPHHLMGILAPDIQFSVAEYVELAHETIADISTRGRVPVVAGGTGLYVDSLLEDIEFSGHGSDPAVRKELTKMLAESGAERLHEMLRAQDPALAARLHPNNTGRVIRALEVFRLTGQPMSELQAQSRRGESRYESLVIFLDFNDRAQLYRRIDRRVDDMAERGLLREAETLRDSGLKTAAQAIGYKEWEPYFAGEKSLGEVIAAIKQNTRRYAKRQQTWFRRNAAAVRLAVDGYADPAALCEDAVRLAEGFLRDEYPEMGRGDN